MKHYDIYNDKLPIVRRLAQAVSDRRLADRSRHEAMGLSTTLLPD